jgi:hypothetical protein
VTAGGARPEGRDARTRHVGYWLTHDGQASAAANGYVPLPAQVQQLAHTMLGQITDPTGAHLLS